MDIQATLTLMIQAVVMGVVSLMVFDFVSGLWVVPLPPAGWQSPVIEQPTVSAVALQPTPQPQIEQCTPVIAFEEIPDPWTLEPQFPHHCLPASAFIVPFPTLRLLPAAKVQPTKPKRTTAKSSKPPKSASTPKRQSTKPSKITA